MCATRPFRLRLLSANLLNGRADPAAFARLVSDLAPDVVLVQELAPEQADALAAVVPHGKLEPTRDYHGLGIALREPAPVWRLPLPYRDAVVTELTPDGAAASDDPVEIINVHIAAPHVPPVWQSFGRRHGQLAGLLRHLDGAPGRSRVIMGDLNATPLWPLYRRLAGQFTDAAVEASRGNGHRLQPTWGPWPGSPRLLRIDHALVRGLAVEGVRVLPVAGSDHSALLVDLYRGDIAGSAREG